MSRPAAALVLVLLSGGTIAAQQSTPVPSDTGTALVTKANAGQY